MSVKEFGVGFRDMKKLLGILVLGLLWCNTVIVGITGIYSNP
jgi:hypothetical protein